MSLRVPMYRDEAIPSASWYYFGNKRIAMTSAKKILGFAILLAPWLTATKKLQISQIC